MTIATQFTLSAAEFEFLWEHLHLGRIPYPLEVPVGGITMAERAGLRASTLDGMRGKGLLHDERPDPDLADLLRVLAAPTVSVDTVGFGDGPIRGLAASDGSHAALAALHDGTLSFATIRPTSLATSIVEVLPAGDAGSGHAVSLPYKTMKGTADWEDDPFGDGDEHAMLVAGGVSDKDATLLLELAGRRVRGGQFGLTTTGPPTRLGPGARLRSATVITWFDTPDGRYLMVYDDDWVSIAPADAARIAHRVDDLIRSAGRRQP